MKEYKNILFDLDNTLVNDDENRKYAFSEILKLENIEVTKGKLEKFIQIDNKYWKDRALGKLKDHYEFKNNNEKNNWVRAQRFIIYFKKISLEKAISINIRYEELLKEKVIPMPNAQKILEYIYDKKYNIYIITNGPTRAIESKLKKI